MLHAGPSASSTTVWPIFRTSTPTMITTRPLRPWAIYAMPCTEPTASPSSTPEYAGAMPGALKNLLEWLIGDEAPRSIYEKPVGWVNTSPRGARRPTSLWTPFCGTPTPRWSWRPAEVSRWRRRRWERTGWLPVPRHGLTSVGWLRPCGPERARPCREPGGLVRQRPKVASIGATSADVCTRWSVQVSDGSANATAVSRRPWVA